MSKQQFVGGQRPLNSRERRSRVRINEFSTKTAEKAEPGSTSEWGFQAGQKDFTDPYERKQKTSKPRSFNRRKSSKSPSQSNAATDVGKVFELDDMITLIPDQKFNYINLDHSGYLTLLDETYRHLTTIDSRLTRQMSFGAFQHVMVEYLWARLFYLAQIFNVDIPFSTERLWDLVGARKALIPGEIHQYLKGLGQFTDGFKNVWRPNFPDICVPIERPEDNILGGGHFGQPTAEGHNVYETMISPYTTSSRVRAEIANEDEFAPLPDEATPDNAIPTENFLGYVPTIPTIHNDARARMQYVRFNSDPIGSRIQHSSELVNVVNSILNSLADKAIIEEGIPDNTEGSTSSIAYVVTETEEIDDLLRRSPITVESRSQMTRAEIGQMVLFTYRRRRQIRTPGVCYTDDAGEIINGWSETINNSFLNEEPFETVNGENDDLLQNRAFALHTTNDRPLAVAEWIRNHFKKKDVIKRRPY